MERLHKSLNGGELDPRNPRHAEWEKYDDLQASTVDVAAAASLLPAQHRQTWLRVYESRNTDPQLSAVRARPFRDMAVAAADETATVLEDREMHALRRFLRITLHRLRNSPSSSAPPRPFTPGDLEIVLETNARTFPMHDPGTGERYTALDAVVLMHKYSVLFRDHLRLSWGVRPNPSRSVPPPHPGPWKRRPEAVFGVAERMMLGLLKRRLNDPEFRLRFDGQDV